MGLETTAFRIEGSRSLRVFSAYLGIDTTTGSCPTAMSARVPDLLVASLGQASGEYRVLPAGVRRWSLNVPYGVTNARGTELETAAAGAERTGVYGVVPDRVEELSHRRLRGQVVPGDRQGATVGCDRCTGRRGARR